VPRVVGLKQEQAVARLTHVGLEPKTVLRPANGKPAGVVVSQRPLEATKLARCGQVTLVVSSGAPQAAVPDLRGSSLADARTKLSTLGLRPIAKQVVSTESPGTVVGQSPAAGAKLRRGAAVTLSVAKAAPVTVPDVTGRQQPAATSALKAAGFTVNAVAVAGAQPSGQVVAQSPPAGAKAVKGSAVRINISDGSTAPRSTTTATTATTTAAAPPPPPAPTIASVPDVTSSDLRSAVQELNGAGFLASIQYVPGEDPLGTIVAQSPTGGSSAKTRSHVTVNASSGPGQKTQETVPDVTGQTLPQAIATLHGAHLRLVFLKVPVTDRAQAGKAVEQTPAAGKQAPENAQVLVYLGAFKQR
jgi:serine/threonine-protein kinase